MDNKEVLYQLYDIISDRKINPKQGSYTNYLFEKGLDKILKKVGEETAETIIAAKNNDKNEVIYELSDLLYHISVLLSEKQITWDDVFEELKKRELKESNLKQFHERTEI
ncbi:MAG: phosphoribosyl-ATP diphosphatase [Firmicutes bacterium]|jgi:phosphoribosyl-ATP pyrophosphohydrolase|nr:phosphoribosyl-ATP diphosphatase [Bacillota bacterium]